MGRRSAGIIWTAYASKWGWLFQVPDDRFCLLLRGGGRGLAPQADGARWAGVCGTRGERAGPGGVAPARQARPASSEPGGKAPICRRGCSPYDPSILVLDEPKAADWIRADGGVISLLSICPAPSWWLPTTWSWWSSFARAPSFWTADG